MNEPTYAAMGGAPPGYDAAAYGRDVRIFRDFLTRATPGTLFLGPGSVGEGGSLPVSLGGADLLPSQDLLAATGPVFDIFSYHFYGAVSERMQAAARNRKHPRTPHCQPGGSPRPIWCTPTMPVCETVSCRASRCG